MANKLYGGLISPKMSSLRAVGTVPAAAAGGGGGADPDHSKTVVMYTLNNFIDGDLDSTPFSGIDIGPKFYLNNGATLSGVEAHADKGFSGALQLNVASDGNHTLEFEQSWVDTSNFLYHAGVNLAVGASDYFDMTLEFYFRTTQTWTDASGNGYSFMGMYPSRNYWVLTKYGPNDSLCLYYTEGGWATADFGIGSAEVSPNTWYHVRLAYDQSAGRGEYFLDGVHTGGEAVLSSMGGPSGWTNGIFKIGDEDTFGTTHFSGQICGFAIRAAKDFVSTDTFVPPTLSQMLAGNWD